MKGRLFGYTRVSTLEQTRFDRTSLEDQAVLIERRATKELEEIFVDAGISGATPLHKRPQGKAMLSELQPGDAIIASKLDRLFRSASDALTTVEQLKARGVDVILIDMGDEPVTANGMSKLFFSMLAAFAEFERGRIAERLSDGRAGKRRRNGYIGGDPPYGYSKTGKGREAMLEPIPEEQAVLSEMANLRGAGLTFAEVAERMEASGARTRGGHCFSRQHIHRILSRNAIDEQRKQA